MTGLLQNGWRMAGLLQKAKETANERCNTDVLKFIGVENRSQQKWEDHLVESRSQQNWEDNFKFSGDVTD